MSRILTPTLVALALVAAGAAQADDDDCRGKMAEWRSSEETRAYVAGLGIEIRKLEIDDGCYEIDGRDADGNKVELKLEPATLGLRELEVEFRDGADASRYIAGARGPEAPARAAPAGNPLFEDGSTPAARQN